MGEHVRLEVDAERRVGTILLDRPPMNALSTQVFTEIGQCLEEAESSDDVAALVVWGGPKVFAAGADIKQFPEWGPDEARESSTGFNGVLDRLARSPLVSIAAINGYALGGGCELALACDFRFAADNAKLGQPEILLGLIPGAGGSQRLPRLIGLARAKELIFTGRMVDMTEAPGIGLVDAVFTADDVYEQACTQAAVYAKGPAALRHAKRAIEEGIEMPLPEALKLEVDLFADTFTTEDRQIGVISFLENGPGQAAFTGA